MSQSLESLIDEVNECGYLLANLFQLSDRRWQANLRTSEGKLFFEYGRGATPYMALLAAFTHMGEGQEAFRTTLNLSKAPSIPSPEGLKKVLDEGILASLGLKKREIRL